MKKISTIVFAIIFLISFSPKAWAGQVPVQNSAEACVLMYQDGECIYEKNADAKHLIASTTKIMTAIVCIENCDLKETVRIKSEYCDVEGSSMYLKAGERYSVKELLLGLMLSSGNDAALAIAGHCSGDVKSFVKLMNEKAKELSMDGSAFANPHGLDQAGHYSTARDMAKLMLYCMENPVFREITETYTTYIKAINHVNHNKLLVNLPGCIGGKTGFTAAAGRCLVSCCERNGMRFVCVTLSDPDDWIDHSNLYEYAFENYCLYNPLGEREYRIPLVSGNKSSISLKAEKSPEIFVKKGEHIKLSAEIPLFVFAPVKIGETAGKICVIIKDNVVAELPLVYNENAVLAYPCLFKADVEDVI